MFLCHNTEKGPQYILTKNYLCQLLHDHCDSSNFTVIYFQLYKSALQTLPEYLKPNSFHMTELLELDLPLRIIIIFKGKSI